MPCNLSDIEEESPCSNHEKVSEAIGTCTATVDFQMFPVNGNPADDFGLNEDSCG